MSVDATTDDNEENKEEKPSEESQEDTSLEEAIELAYDTVAANEKAEGLEAEPKDKESAKKESKEKTEPNKKAPEENDLNRQTGDKDGSKPEPLERSLEKEGEGKEVTAIEPPISWRQNAKSAWAKLPQDLQTEVKRVEEAQRADYLQKTREISNKEEQLKQAYGDLPDVVKPYLHSWSAEGKTPGKVIGDLLQMQNFASQKPEEFLLWYANTYGVDASKVANAQRGGAVDPNQQHLNRELVGLRNRLARHETGLANQAQSRRVSEEEGLAREVQAFQAATDESGSLKHPYLREVLAEFKATIPLIMQGNAGASPQEIFKEAYERAVHSNPATRSKVLQGLEAERLKRIGSDTASAERAGKLITGNAAGNDKLPDADDLDAVIRYAWDKHADEASV